jgi:hypothetical protein
MLFRSTEKREFVFTGIKFMAMARYLSADFLPLVALQLCEYPGVYFPPEAKVRGDIDNNLSINTCA